MILTLPVTDDGSVDPRFGRASTMAVAEVTDGQITSWTTHDVGWDVLHDEGPHGTHHGRIVRFLKEHNVERVLFVRMGDGMINTINKMGLVLIQVDPVDAKEIVLQAAAIDPSDYGM